MANETEAVSEITKIVCYAIDLPDCPVKKKQAVQKRIWLKLQIENLVNAERSRNTVIQGVAEDAAGRGY